MKTMIDNVLPKTMPAVVCLGPKDYRLEEVPVPQAGPEEVIIKVSQVGICASDLKSTWARPCFGAMNIVWAIASHRSSPVTNLWAR